VKVNILHPHSGLPTGILVEVRSDVRNVTPENVAAVLAAEWLIDQVRDALREERRLQAGAAEGLCGAVRQAVAGNDPDIDDDDERLWQAFWAMNRGRQAGMNSWLPLPAAEMKACAEMMGESFTPGEWRILGAMDVAFLDASTGEGKAAPTQDITPSAFDAVFG
jgi:hypothetical protein